VPCDKRVVKRTRLLAALGLVCALGCRASQVAEHDAAPTPAATPTGVARTPELIRRDGNHLLGASSAYLRQHAHNPVDWYTWGPEALALAVKLDRPIFLSIGYVSCHWCHVMEKEVFEQDDVARYLNEHFISIKVDREERPDLDAAYMAAVQTMTGSGGWPMTALLTPSLRPFFGGTYLPHAQFLQRSRAARRRGVREDRGGSAPSGASRARVGRAPRDRAASLGRGRPDVGRFPRSHQVPDADQVALLVGCIPQMGRRRPRARDSADTRRPGCRRCARPDRGRLLSEQH
jgi:hypothetical protein